MTDTEPGFEVRERADSRLGLRPLDVSVDDLATVCEGWRAARDEADRAERRFADELYLVADSLAEDVVDYLTPRVTPARAVSLALELLACVARLGDERLAAALATADRPSHEARRDGRPVDMDDPWEMYLIAKGERE